MKHIIAIGGAGFSTNPSSSHLLEKYLIQTSSKERPSICFIPTASGDAAPYIKDFYTVFDALGCRTSHLSLFSLPTNDLEGFLLEKDIIFVGGGNTKSMLALWREWHVDAYLKKAYNSGIVLTGSSAGGNCWFEECVTDSLHGHLSALPCLGFLKGSFCPHYESEKNRRPSYHNLLQNNHLSAGLALDDHVAAHFIDGSLSHIVRANKTGRAYALSKKGNQVEEVLLDTITLS